MDASKTWVCDDRSGRPPSADDAACLGNLRFVDGQCVAARCDAGGETHCCPGTFCNAGGICQIPPSRVHACNSDADCEGGLRCLDRPRISSDSKTCGFAPVDADGGCSNGEQPFNQRCVTSVPCDGKCGNDQICNIDTNACEQLNLPEDAAPSCQQTCGEGELLVYSDPDTMLFDLCCEVSCECATLPPIEPGTWGRFSDSVATDNALLVSAYDSTYGDLVLAVHGRESGELQSLYYVDGVPESGSLGGDPKGIRNGLITPGPDTGQYTAIALHADQPRIAYYDVQEGRLKFAAFDPDANAWRLMVVDDGMGGSGGSTTGSGGDEASEGGSEGSVDDGVDVGRYTDLVIDSNGIAHISYFAHNVWMDDGQAYRTTTPMYARATTPTPSSPDDWERVAIEPLQTCDGACGDDEVCVQQGGEPRCLPAVSSEACGAPCDCDHVCADGGGATQCYLQLPNRIGHDGASAPSVVGLPNGIGLFTSIAIYDDAPLVTYYDRVRGHLRGAVANFNADGDARNGFTTIPIACASGTDVGQHASLAVAPDGLTLAVAFQGNGGETLWVYRGDDLLTGQVELVDDGAREDSLHLVGGYASAAFASDGGLYIAYADQSSNDLRLAYEDPYGSSDGAWKHTALLTDGAYGSFAKLVIADSTAYVSTYMRQRNGAASSDNSRLVVHVQDLNALE